MTGARNGKGRVSRRAMLVSAAGAAGALVVGWSVLPQRSRLGSPGALPHREGTLALNGWIRIASNGDVVVAMPRSEMGQGVHTALPALVAEELDIPLARIRLEQAGHDAIYGNVSMFVSSLPFHPLESEGAQPAMKVRAGEWMVAKIARELGINATGGSSSVADAWTVLRLAAATARGSLLGAASLQWKLPVAELVVRDGVISHVSGPSAHFGQLASHAANTPPGDVSLKEPAQWKLIGKPLARTDVPSKVDGSAVFGLDIRLPGMLYAAIRLCPMLGGAPGAIQAEQALSMPGAVRLVRLPAYAGSTAGFAIVGKTYWHAQQAVRAVQVDWHQRPHGPLNSKAIDVALEQAARNADGFTFHERGSIGQAMTQASKTHEAVYRAPYLAHATMEPMNCTARVSADGVEVWAPTQVPGMARDIAARVAGVPADQVVVHVTMLGGGFGRRLEVDYVAQAVRVAMDCAGVPVQLIWSREEDTRHDFYRPAHVAVMKAAIDTSGEVTGLRITSAGDAITPRWIARGLPYLAGRLDMPDKTAAEGLFDLPYAIHHQHMSHIATRMGVPVGFWRSVGHSHNAFFSESFIDELAQLVQQDPVVFRRRLLAHAPRYAEVLDLAAREAKWGKPLSPGRARGVALHESFGSIVAQVVELSVSGGAVKVHHVTCAIDCGTVVNPQIVAQQVEGSVVYALSAALHGGVTIVDGVVREGNFHEQPVVRLGDAPVVSTHIVPSHRPPAGVGEPAVPPLAPAVANALSALGLPRIRELPLRLV